jgi:O-succinylbenzoate synthase
LLSSNLGELAIIDGAIEVKDLVPNFEGLDVSADRYEWWKNRIMITAALLG